MFEPSVKTNTTPHHHGHTMTLETLKSPILNRSELCKQSGIHYQTLMKRLERGTPELTAKEIKSLRRALRSAGLTELDHG